MNTSSENYTQSSKSSSSESNQLDVKKEIKTGVGFIVRQGIEAEFHPLIKSTYILDIMFKEGRKLILHCYAPTNPTHNRDE